MPVAFVVPVTAECGAFRGHRRHLQSLKAGQLWGAFREGMIAATARSAASTSRQHVSKMEVHQFAC